MNNTGIKKTSATNPKSILYTTAGVMSVGIVVSAAAGNSDKIIKAGTPLAGNLTARTTAFTAATGADTVGVLLHDVDVSNGDNNATLMIAGYVNLDRLDSAVSALITEEVKTALKGNVTFLK